jgi:hypothetical protein
MGEQGDCYRACLASILNMPAREVPNFADAVDEAGWDAMFAAVRAWLRERGIGLFRTYCSAGWEIEKLLEVFSGANPGVPIILSARSRRNPDDNHAVVVMDGRIIHDPSNSGIDGPVVHVGGDSGWYWLDVIAFADHSELRNLQPPAAGQ